IHTDGARMFLTPTYHVYMMYKPFRGATALATDLTTPDYAFGADRVPAIRASAARTADGRIVLALVNLDPHRAAHVAAARLPYTRCPSRAQRSPPTGSMSLSPPSR